MTNESGNRTFGGWLTDNLWTILSATAVVAAGYATTHNRIDAVEARVQVLESAGDATLTARADVVQRLTRIEANLEYLTERQTEDRERNRR